MSWTDEDVRLDNPDPEHHKNVRVYGPKPTEPGLTDPQPAAGTEVQRDYINRIDRELAAIAYCRGWVAAFDQIRQNPYIVRKYSDAWQRGFQDGIEARRKASETACTCCECEEGLNPTYSDCEDCDGK